MFASTHPERERIRAQAVLRSLTEYREAVDMFAPKNQGEPAESAAQANPNDGWSIRRAFNAIKRNQRPAVDESVQQTVYAGRRAPSSGFSR